MKQLLSRLMHDEDGQDIIEYVLIAAAISVIAIPIVPDIGSAVEGRVGPGRHQVGPPAEVAARRGAGSRRCPALLDAGAVAPPWSARAARLLVRLVREDDGQDIIEYVLLTAAVGLVSLATWPLIETAIRTSYQTLDTDTQNLWQPPNPSGGGP